MPIIDIVICTVLSLIFYEDIKHRAVRWYYFLLLWGLVMFNFFTRSGDFSFVLINACFILFQLGSVALYIFIRYRSWRFIDKFIGLGDLLIWGVFIFAFSPLNFAAFFIVGLMFSTVLYLLVWYKRKLTIPLAGLQSILMLFILCLRFFSVQFDLYDDIKILDLLNCE